MPSERERLSHKSKGGRFREIFVVGDDRATVAKVPRASIKKRYPFGEMSIPAAPYVLLKFGVVNVNEVDHRNYLALPEIVRTLYAPSTRMLKGVLVQERVLDFDGSPSLSVDEYVAKHGRIVNKHFWEEVRCLKDLLLTERVYLLGAFYGGSNIMIKRLSPTDWRPILIDFKRLGNRSYPFQPHLSLRSNLEKKFIRQYARFCRKFAPTSEE